MGRNDSSGWGWHDYPKVGDKTNIQRVVIIFYWWINCRKCPINCRFLQSKKDLWFMIKLNYNFVHDVLKKIGARPELVTKNCRPWMIATWEYYGKVTGNHDEEDKDRKRWQNGSMKLIENKNTEDGVIFKGERM